MVKLKRGYVSTSYPHIVDNLINCAGFIFILTKGTILYIMQMYCIVSFKKNSSRREK